jgi:hypothetical protein
MGKEQNHPAQEKQILKSLPVTLLVGAVWIELLNKFTKSHVITVLSTASQMNWS